VLVKKLSVFKHGKYRQNNIPCGFVSEVAVIDRDFDVVDFQDYEDLIKRSLDQDDESVLKDERS